MINNKNFPFEYLDWNQKEILDIGSFDLKKIFAFSFSLNRSYKPGPLKTTEKGKSWN